MVFNAINALGCIQKRASQGQVHWRWLVANLGTYGCSKSVSSTRNGKKPLLKQHRKTSMKRFNKSIWSHVNVRLGNNRFGSQLEVIPRGPMQTRPSTGRVAWWQRSMPPATWSLTWPWMARFFRSKRRIEMFSDHCGENTGKQGTLKNYWRFLFWKHIFVIWKDIAERLSCCSCDDCACRLPFDPSQGRLEDAGRRLVFSDGDVSVSVVSSRAVSRFIEPRGLDAADSGTDAPWRWGDDLPKHEVRQTMKHRC